MRSTLCGAALSVSVGLRVRVRTCMLQGAEGSSLVEFASWADVNVQSESKIANETIGSDFGTLGEETQWSGAGGDVQSRRFRIH